MAVLKEMYPLTCHSDTYKNTFLGPLVGQLTSTCFPGFANLMSKNAKYELLIVRFYIHTYTHTHTHTHIYIYIYECEDCGRLGCHIVAEHNHKKCSYI